MIVPAPMKPSDRARSDEAQSGDDLGAQTAHVGGKSHDQINVMAGKRSSSCSCDNENVCPETGRSVLHRPLDSDDTAADNREDHAE